MKTSCRFKPCAPLVLCVVFAIHAISCEPIIGNQRLMLAGARHVIGMQARDKHEASAKTIEQANSLPRASIMTIYIDSQDYSLVTGGSDGTVVVWEYPPSEPRNAFFCHDTVITALNYSRECKAIAAGGANGRVLLLNDKTGVLVHTLVGHEGAVRALDFSTDGKYLVSGGNDGVAILWDVAMGKDIKRLKGSDLGITCLDISKNMNKIAAGTKDNRVILWELMTGSRLLEMKEHSSSIGSVVFAPDSSLLASGGQMPDCRTVTWRAEGHRVDDMVIHAQDAVTSLCFSRDGKILATGTRHGALIVSNLAGQVDAFRVQAHSDVILFMTFLNSDDKLISASRDGTAKEWAITEGSLVHEYDIRYTP